MLETKEKPLPNKSTNITLAKAVSDYELGWRVISGLRRMGPIPAMLMNWAELPGEPTTTSNG